MIDLTVKTLDSQNHSFSLENDQITVRGFKEYIAETVAVPADSQRLIYCGRILRDEKKLNDYDVNGKVIHLVQHAPPQLSQRGNDAGQSQNQSQNHVSQMWQNPQRTHYRLTRAQMHGNAMYLGAMSVPAEIVEGHGLQVPQFSNSLSNGRLVAARHMLERADRLMDRLESPSPPANRPASENNRPPLSQLMQESEIDADQYNNESRANGGARLAEAAAAAIAAALSAAGANNVTLLRGNSDENTESRPVNETNEENQSDTQPPQQPQSEQGSMPNNDEQFNRRSSPQLPRPPQLAELLELLLDTQSRLLPHIERYRKLMHDDPSLPPGRQVEENQTFVDGVSECLHYMSHACHALSDIIVDMSQQPPRNLRCRPIVIQHSAVLQPGIPIQVEAHISLHGRNANNNNGNEENGETGNTPAQSETTEASTDDANQQQESESDTQQSEQQPPPQQQQQQQQSEPTQSPFGTLFNLPNNVEVLMAVSPEGNIDAAPGSEQPQGGENNNNNNNNNNNGGRIGGTTGAFSWGSAASPDFIRNLMQAVAGHMVQGAITTTPIITRNPLSSSQQSASMDSGNANAGQSTQARSNVGTHPTTATQTRSTSRPHVFHQQTHPLGVGMSIGQAFDFDPFLPCNSHHVRRTSTTASSTITSTSQGTQTSQTTIAETQTQAQTATTSSATSNTSSTNTTASTTSQTTMNDPSMYLLQRTFRDRVGQPRASIIINSNNPDLAENFGSTSNSVGGNLSLADLLERRGIQMSLFTSQDSESAENFLLNLSVLVVQNMTLEGLIRLRIGQWEPISYLRRPLQEFFLYSFPNVTPDEIQEQAPERLLSQLRPHFQTLLSTEEDTNSRSGQCIDICATVEALLRRHIEDMLQHLFDIDIDDDRFGQEIFNIVNNMGRQLCAVLRYSIRGGQAGLEVIASRFVTKMLEGIHLTMRRWVLNAFVIQFRTYSLRIAQPPDSEILPLLIYKDVPSQTTTVSSAPTHQPSQMQSEAEPMETETVEERTTFEASSLPEDGEEISESFPGHEALPSDWVPIIARDGVRQRRQLQMPGMTDSGVATFSDAYLGTLPTKRRKLIEQQKSRLLVSPTPNNSAIAASMERLVREGVSRAGVEEVEGAAVAVAVDPGVRRAFGQAIRDCLYPHRYGTPDFPNPLRFPNATKYFADQDRPPKY